MKVKNRENFNILTDEEITKMAKEGSGSAYEFLLKKYRDLVKNIARKYYIAGAENEDVIQEGTIGLFKAVRDYDEDSNNSFKSFAALCVERQIQTAVSGANRDKHKILNESISLYPDEDREGDNLREALSREAVASKKQDPEKLALIKETFDEMRELSKTILSPMERKVFSGLLLGKTYQEIAEEMNKTPKSIDNAIQRIKKKIGLNFSDY